MPIAVDAKRDQTGKGRVASSKRSSYSGSILKGFQKFIVPNRSSLSENKELVPSQSETQLPAEESNASQATISTNDVSTKGCTPDAAIPTSPSPCSLSESLNLTVSETTEHMDLLNYSEPNINPENEMSFSLTPDSDVNLPIPEIYQPSQAASSCSWVPFYEFFAPLFCLPIGSVTEPHLEEPEVIVYPHPQFVHPAHSPRLHIPRSLHGTLVLDDIPENNSAPEETLVVEHTLYHGMSSEYIKSSIENLVDTAKDYLNLSAAPKLHFQWVLQSLKNDIEIHSSNIPGNPAAIIRSKYLVNCPAGRVKNVLLSEHTMQILDPTLERYETVFQLPSLNVVARKYFYKAYFPISPRDFVALTAWIPVDDGILIVSSSLPDSYFPEIKGFVRGYVILSAFYLKVLSEHVTEVTVINHANVMANVPSYILNKAATNIPMQYAKSLRKLCSSDFA